MFVPMGSTFAAIRRLVDQNTRILISNAEQHVNQRHIIATSAFCVKEINLPELQGHFPGRPVLPAVLTLEAMIQTAAVSIQSATQGPLEVVELSHAKFRKMITPPCSLFIQTETAKDINNGGYEFFGLAKKDGEVATEARFRMKAGRVLRRMASTA
eukprot:Plantae.Rhodophyta-Hildenbrandia_rubra.ctg27254.p3 GENE.Plantae.Rhodophyta-Hildenbrandia_rubra.ctg27254~~Plantae.Rhodophyta-Hildenbrandia_rubra.ctg27254.p3  ORF type:complete len:156 (+),score=25.94 Plantae.Rhodophyta-Hildenbrandia_rubra.ctg27254:1197-1664(+)